MKKRDIKKERSCAKLEPSNDKKAQLSPIDELKKLKKELAVTKLALSRYSEAPIVSDMDDVPEDLATRAFPSWQRNARTGSPCRVQSFPLDKVSTSYFGVNDLFNTYIVRERNIRKKTSTEDQSKVTSKVLSHPGSDRGSETRSALGIFFRFVDKIIKPSSMDLRYLLDTRVAGAFPRWYEASGKQPSTQGNVIKILRMFLHYLNGLEAFANYRNRIDAVDQELRVPGAKAKDNARAAANKMVAERLNLLGQWLTQAELCQLNQSVCDKITEILEGDIEYLTDRSASSLLSKKELNNLMGHIFLVALMHLGGQRRQFPASMNVNNVVFEGAIAKFYPPPEKVKRAKTDHFVLPSVLAVPLRLWIQKYAPLLSNNGVESVWVDSRGNAMRYKGLGYLVTKVVRDYFPGRNITCTYFRRALVSFLTEHHLHNDDEGVAKFFGEKHAALINTSPQVIATHYDRIQRAEVNNRTLEHVNTTVGIKPTTAFSGLLAKFQHKFDEEHADYSRSISKIVGHSFANSRHHVEFIVAFKDGTRETLPGHKLIPYIDLVNIYWASVGRSSCTPRKLAYGSESSHDVKDEDEGHSDSSSANSDNDVGSDASDFAGESHSSDNKSSDDSEDRHSDDDKESADEESDDDESDDEESDDEESDDNESDDEDSDDEKSDNEDSDDGGSDDDDQESDDEESKSKDSINSLSHSTSSSDRSSSIMSKSTNVNESFALPLSSPESPPIVIEKIADSDVLPLKQEPRAMPPKPKPRATNLGNSAKKTNWNPRRIPTVAARKNPIPFGSSINNADGVPRTSKPLLKITGKPAIMQAVTSSAPKPMVVKPFEFKVNLAPSTVRVGEKRTISLAMSNTHEDADSVNKKQKKM